MLLLSFLVEVTLYFGGTLAQMNDLKLLLSSTMGGRIAGRNKLNNEESLVPFILPNNRMSIGSKLIYYWEVLCNMINGNYIFLC